MFIYIAWLCINNYLGYCLRNLFSFIQDLLLNVGVNLHVGSFSYLENYWPCHQAMGESKSYELF